MRSVLIALIVVAGCSSTSTASPTPTSDAGPPTAIGYEALSAVRSLQHLDKTTLGYETGVLCPAYLRVAATLTIAANAATGRNRVVLTGYALALGKRGSDCVATAKNWVLTDAAVTDIATYLQP